MLKNEDLSIHLFTHTYIHSKHTDDLIVIHGTHTTDFTMNRKCIDRGIRLPIVLADYRYNCRQAIKIMGLSAKFMHCSRVRTLCIHNSSENMHNH